MAQTFYQACAQASFALLGLWWVVVNRRFDDWVNDPDRRRLSYVVSLYFALPGIISLTSLIAADSATVWRVGFTAAGALGIAVTLFALATVGGGSGARAHSLVRGVLAATAILYGLVVAVALWTGLPAEIDLELTPRETEAMLVTALVFLGVNLAWVMFMEPAEEPPAA